MIERLVRAPWDNTGDHNCPKHNRITSGFARQQTSSTSKLTIYLSEWNEASNSWGEETSILDLCERLDVNPLNFYRAVGPQPTGVCELFGQRFRWRRREK